MLEPIPFWGMIEVDLPVKTYAGNKSNYIKEDMNNELVAIRYDFDGYGYRYIDSGSGSDWVSLNKNVDGEFLYTHPVKELTDEEIISTMVQFDVYSSDDHCLIEAGRAILRKASEK